MQVCGLCFAIKQKITVTAVKAVTVILVFSEGERFMDVSSLLLGYFIVLSGYLRGYLSSL